MKRKIAAIMAADVAGYSRLVAEDEEETLRRLAAYREVFDDFVKRYGGRIFNTAGDSVMSEFDSAVEATRAAIDIQESLRTRNLAYPPSRRVQFRIGITIGDVVERNGDLLGDGVNIAARLESLADAGGICVSRSVHEAVANKVSVPFRDLGARELKNIPQLVHAYVIAWPGEKAPPEPRPVPRRDDAARRVRGHGVWRGAAIAAVVLLVVFVAVPGLRAVKRAIEGQVSPATTTPEGRTNVAAPALPVSPPPVRPGPDKPSAPADPAQHFAALARQGGLVEDAKTAPELYHNGRLLEARGDAFGARRAYTAVAGLGRELVDPHLRLSALLREQDGRAGAREAYSELMAAHPAKIVELVRALQFEGADRRTRVEAFAAENPDFAPAQYLLAEEYSEDRLGTQTLTDRRLEFEALERFLEAEADGNLAALFLDHSVLGQWLDRARRRKAAIEAFFKTASTRPTATFSRSNAGWTAALFMPEAATGISWRLGEAGDFKSTGVSPATDPRTGKPAPMPTFELPPDQGKATIYVRYEDAAGHAAGPFVVTFDPHEALVTSQRRILDMTAAAWLSFRADRDSPLYYTHLAIYRCAIKSAAIGLDDGPLEVPLPLPPCDEANPFAVPAEARPYISIPESVEAVSVRLTYADGAQSELRTFRRQ